jgi:enoyl-CoA hydratase
MDTAPPPLLIDRSTPAVAVLTLNRPEARNALNRALRDALRSAFETLTSDSDVRCIVVTGGPKVFAAGADLRDMVERGAMDMQINSSAPLWRSIVSCPRPIIAAVNGYAWGGGCELAMHADIIVAGESASFAQPEVKVGIMPGAGGTQRLPRAVGKFKAMKMLLTGQAVPAAEAFAMGLVSEVVADADVLPAALTMAETIAALPPLAVAQIKEAVLAGQDAPLDTALLLERRAFQLLFDSEDQKEGMRAFLEKRKPVFRGR